MSIYHSYLPITLITACETAIHVSRSSHASKSARHTVNTARADSAAVSQQSGIYKYTSSTTYVLYCLFVFSFRFPVLFFLVSTRPYLLCVLRMWQNDTVTASMSLLLFHFLFKYNTQQIKDVLSVPCTRTCMAWFNRSTIYPCLVNAFLCSSSG